jgi:glucose/arabinose dehydrogenase
MAAACGEGGSTPENTAAQGSPTATITVPGVATDGPSTAPPSPSPTPTPEPLAVKLDQYAGGFERPVFVTHAGDGSARLFVLEKAGVIRIVVDGEVRDDPFLDISQLVTIRGNEQGLLGLAFHPQYEENGRFFVYYTAVDGGANTVAEYRVSTDANIADAGSGRVMLAIADTRSNHNGGMLAFGPDGYLYVATGDGGGGGDPDENGQALDALLAKILRLDVDGSFPYTIPPSNPFASTGGARPEVWAFGLRNPWRFSFDRETGDMWIADVGQGSWEEVDFQPADSAGGENYGWNTMEGAHCFDPANGCDTSGLVLPVHEYDHSAGCSITGGYVYRGEAIPALRGSTCSRTTARATSS